MSDTNAKKEHMDVLHFEHERWTKQLEFYKDELLTYNHRLEEIVTRYNGRGVMKELESFQNKFIRQNEVIDILKHDIHEHETVLAKSFIENPTASDHRLFDYHDGLRNRMDIFVKLYSELKTGFMRYLSKYM